MATLDAAELGQPDGAILRGLREDAGWSREQVAKWLDMEEHAYAGVEKGYRKLSVKQVASLARLIGKDGQLGSPDQAPLIVEP